MTAPQAMTVANDRALLDLIDSAERRLIVVAPGLSAVVAELLAKRWRLLGAESVSVTLDLDPEVCRLGYGELRAVTLLEQTAAGLHTMLHRHPGLRIGLILADDQTLIYSPTPQYIESCPTIGVDQPLKPNAIHLGSPPAAIERDLGAGPDGVKDQVIGLDKASCADIKALEKNLADLPPQPFDLTQRLRVFTAHLEFVELRLSGCMMHRRTISIPQELLGLTDEKTRNVLESKFHLLDEQAAGAWGQEVVRIKNYIAARFLVRLPGYGHVLRLSQKPRFELAVHTLQKWLDRARRRKAKRLQAAMDRRLALLHEALLPGVAKHRPKHWPVASPGFNPAAELMNELASLVDSASDLLRGAKVEVRYKGVTYETLRDPRFIELVQRHMPDMTRLHEERDAAPARWLSPQMR